MSHSLVRSPMRMAESVCCDCVTDGGSAANRVGGVVEAGGEEAVTGCIDRLAAEAGELAPDGSVVLREGARPLSAVLDRSCGRRDEVGDENGRRHAPNAHLVARA